MFLHVELVGGNVAFVRAKSVECLSPITIFDDKGQLQGTEVALASGRSLRVYNSFEGLCARLKREEGKC